MNKLELIDVLNNAIPEGAGFKAIEIQMYCTLDDHIVTSRYMAEVAQNADIVGKGNTVTASRDFEMALTTIEIKAGR